MLHYPVTEAGARPIGRCEGLESNSFATQVDAFQLVEESPSPAVSKSKARTQQIPCSPQQHQQSSIRPDASEQVQARPSQLSSNAGTCLIGDRQKISSMSPPGSPAAGYASSAEPGREDAGAQGLFADDAGVSIVAIAMQSANRIWQAQQDCRSQTVCRGDAWGLAGASQCLTDAL